jgi:hypothetical protein
MDLMARIGSAARCGAVRCGAVRRGAVRCVFGAFGAWLGGIAAQVDSAEVIVVMGSEVRW